MTTNEAARTLGITVRRVQRLIQDGKLPAQKRGRDYWIEDVDVERAKQRNRKAGRPRDKN